MENPSLRRIRQEFLREFFHSTIYDVILLILQIFDMFMYLHLTHFIRYWEERVALAFRNYF